MAYTDHTRYLVSVLPTTILIAQLPALARQNPEDGCRHSVVLDELLELYRPVNMDQNVLHVAAGSCLAPVQATLALLENGSRSKQVERRSRRHRTNV